MKRNAASIANQLVRAGYRWNEEGLRAAIARLGPEAISDSLISSLLEKLRDRDHHVREPAGDAIRHLGAGTSKKVVDHVVVLLTDQRPLERWYGMVAVGSIYRADIPEAVFQCVVPLLDDPEVRYRAVAVIARSQRVNDEILRRLPGLLEDSDEEVAMASATAVRHLGATVTAHEPIQAALLRLAKHPNPHVANAAAQAIRASSERST